MNTLMKNKGGRVLDVITDCIYCEFPDDQLPLELVENSINYYYYWGNGVYKYKIESIDRHLTVERMQQYKKHDEYASKPNELKLYNDVEGNDFVHWWFYWI
jgi:hypothetical protein